VSTAQAYSLVSDHGPLPAVSVVMPVCNGARFLREAIDSVLGQTLADFELLIVDDGSTDGSVQIVAEYRDARIRLCRQGHGGIVAALNRGVGLARSGLIARMDHDDISLPARLERQHEFLARRPEFAVVGVRRGYVTAAGRRAEPAVRAASSWQELRREDLLQGHLMCHSAAMLRRDAVLAVGGYRAGTEGAEDIDLWLRLHPAYRFALLNEHLFYVRRFARPDAVALAMRRRRVRRRVVSMAEASSLHGCFAGPAGGREASMRERWRVMRSLGGDVVTQLNAGDLSGALAYVRALLAGDPASGLAWCAIGRALVLHATSRALRMLRGRSGRRP
jgi:glycosyltransferase involved in cell wall biosynthesis